MAVQTESHEYLSLLGSAGITRHLGNKTSFFRYSGSIESRRKILAEASHLAILNQTGRAADVHDPLVKILQARLSSNTNPSPSAPQRHLLNLSALTELNGRWGPIGNRPAWRLISETLIREGYAIREVETNDTPGQFANSANFTPILEVVDNGGTVIAGGRGITKDHALHAALGEAVERIVAQAPPLQSIFVSSAAELKSQGFYIPSFDLSIRDAYSEELRIDWVVAQTVTSKRAAFPAELAYYADNTYVPKSGIRAFALHHTAGLAAGSTAAEAVWAGLSECLERDAYWIVMRCRLTCPTIDTKILDPEHTELLQRAASAGLRIVLKDISLDWPIKIVHALVIDDKKRLPAFAHGVGSGTSLTSAANKALLESLQIRSGLLRLCQLSEPTVLLPTTSWKPAPFAWSDPASDRSLSHLYQEPTSVHNCAALDTKEPKALPAIVDEIQEGAGCVTWMKLGEMAGLQVVRVFVPKCIQPHHDPNVIPGRLAEWMARTELQFPYSFPILT